MKLKRILLVLAVVVSAVAILLSFQNCGLKLYGGNGEGVEGSALASGEAPPMIDNTLYFYSVNVCMDETSESMIISDGTRFYVVRTGCADHSAQEIDASLVQYQDGDHTVLVYKKKTYRR